MATHSATSSTTRGARYLEALPIAASATFTSTRADHPPRTVDPSTSPDFDQSLRYTTDLNFIVETVCITGGSD